MDRSLLTDLPVFLAVARHGNMTKAAAVLNTVQSNVTSRIKRLEDDLGATLLVRGVRKLHLTPEGESLMPYALRLEELDRDIKSQFGAELGPQSGSLRIGAIETFAASHLVDIISKFSGQHPYVDLSVQTGGTDILRKRVLDSELDIAFVSRRSNDPALREEKVLNDELVVLAPRSLKSLKDFTHPRHAKLRILVQRVGCSFTARLVEHLRETRQPARAAHAVGTLEGLIGSVRAGSGVAVLPRSYLCASRAKNLLLLPMPKELSSVEIYLVVQRWNLPIRLLNAFVQSCLANKIAC